MINFVKNFRTMSGRALTKEVATNITLIILIYFVTGSCQPKDDPHDVYVNTPIAGFTWTGNNGAAPVTIQFVNTSENANQFEWDFGDYQTSTARDPQHTYQNTSSEPKNLLVVLKATDSGTGLFQRKSHVIVIQPGN
jgi:PKD repeat protein